MYLAYNDETNSLAVNVGVPDLDRMQEIVGDIIAPIDVYRDEDGVVTVYVGDNSLLTGQPPTTILDGDHAHRNYIVHGGFVIVRTDNRGETAPLTKEDVDRIKLGRLQGFVQKRQDGALQTVPVLEVN